MLFKLWKLNIRIHNTCVQSKFIAKPIEVIVLRLKAIY